MPNRTRQQLSPQIKVRNVRKKSKAGSVLGFPLLTLCCGVGNNDGMALLKGDIPQCLLQFVVGSVLLRTCSELLVNMPLLHHTASTPSTCTTPLSDYVVIFVCGPPHHTSMSTTCVGCGAHPPTLMLFLRITCVHQINISCTHMPHQTLMCSHSVVHLYVYAYTDFHDQC